MRDLSFVIGCILFFSCNSGADKTYGNTKDTNQQAMTPIKNPAPDSLGKLKDVIPVFQCVLSHIKSNGEKFNNLLNYYDFANDTVFMLDSVNVYKYDKIKMINFYKDKIEGAFGMRSQDTLAIQYGNQFIRYLNNSNLVIGSVYGETKSIPSGMIECWMFDNGLNAKEAHQLFKKSQNMIFFKTLSFSYYWENFLFVFHSRYTGGSWTIKRYYEWAIKNCIK